MYKRTCPGYFITALFMHVAFLVGWLHAEAQISRYKPTRISEKEGLPASRVYNLLVDRFGYLWVGTINGLARYDGYGFKRFYTDPNDSSTINGLVIWDIFEDKEGLVWVGAGVEHLNAFDPASGGFRHYAYKHLVRRPANVEIGISRISQNKKGRIYFGISTNFGEAIDDGLLYKDPGSDSLKMFTHPDSLQLQNVMAMTSDSIGNTWLMCYSGLFVIDTAGQLIRIRNTSQISFHPDEWPVDLNIDSNGNLWILTNFGNLVGYNDPQKKYTLYRTPFPLAGGTLRNRFIFNGKDEILIAANTGFVSFHIPTEKFEKFPQEQLTGPETPFMASIVKDRFGNIWLGSTEWGLFLMQEKARFTSLTPNSPKPQTAGVGWASRIREDAQGRIWFTSTSQSTGSMLNWYNPQIQTVQFLQMNSLKPGINNVSAFDLLSNGELVLSTNMGVLKFNPGSRSVAPYAIPGFPGDFMINYFLTDRRQNQWLATYRGLYRKKQGEQEFRKIQLDSMPGFTAGSDEISFLFESPRHGLWILSNNGLFLFRYDSQTVERHGYDPQKGNVFLTQDINAVYEDSKGTVWVGIWQGGLSRYNPETGEIKTFTREDGIPSMSIQGILGDEKTGMLWLSTFDGLARFDPINRQSNNYTIDDGIQGQLFADGACFRSSTGNMYFGGSNGITIFHPDNVASQSLPPRVYLTGIKLFNKPLLADASGPLKQSVYETKSITLEHNQNNLSFEFIALHYANAQRNRYAYMLENYDPEWREVTGQREAFYPKLPPGKYVFRVKAANSNGIWNEEGIRLSVTVLPPWWQTPWAYLLYLLGAMGIGLLVDRFVRKRLLAREREKQRLRELDHAREIEKAYHDLAQSHETLKATQAQLIQSEKMASLGELTAGIAHEIQNPLNFVNNFAEVNQELLQEMKEELGNGRPAEASAIANDLLANEAKIAEHGRRAEAIVKNMLMHSRAAAGEKESTDINALADEYLKLAYHGLRAKDKGFNATLETDYAPNLPPVPVVTQDIGRVFLNLFNNAFYAVREKQKTAGQGYMPTVKITTDFQESLASDEGKGNLSEHSPSIHYTSAIILSVRDNGSGIPETLKDKIFQPFFTTKPTGQGTGLGLSLSYDIIKAHGGSIVVDSRPGEYTIFTVVLPI